MHIKCPNMQNVSAVVAPQAHRKLSLAEAFARAEYERLHPDDTFDDLKRRARFSKEDEGLLRDWLAAAARQHFHSCDE
ncbi:MAG TPA: hypothetical protein VFS63_11685 [Pseudolabrys sp.]|nr:hypothetical protein [Pseudolabrys sp.]